MVSAVCLSIFLWSDISTGISDYIRRFIWDAIAHPCLNSKGSQGMDDRLYPTAVRG